MKTLKEIRNELIELLKADSAQTHTKLLDAIGMDDKEVSRLLEQRYEAQANAVFQVVKYFESIEVVE